MLSLAHDLAGVALSSLGWSGAVNYSERSLINWYWVEGQREGTDVPTCPTFMSVIDLVDLFSFYLGRGLHALARIGLMKRAVKHVPS